MSAVVFAVHQTGRRANGGVRSIAHVIERLATPRPVVLTNIDSEVTRRWRDLGLEVVVGPFVGREGSDAPRGARALPGQAARLAGASLRAVGLIRRHGARVVHANDIRSFWTVAPAAGLTGASLVFNVRDIKEPGSPYGKRWRLARSLASRTVVLSDEMRQAFETRVRPVTRRRAGDVVPIYSVVDPGQMAPGSRSEARAELALPTNAEVLVVVAALMEKKNQLGLVRDVLPGLAAARPEARLYFVGDAPPGDPYSDAVRRAASRVGLDDRIRFVGFQSDVATWYRAADLTLVRSRREGLARCMIESLACGTPVVSSDVCSAREILERHDVGVVVGGGDPAHFVTAVTELLERPARRLAMGERAVRVARELFAPEAVVSAYRALYRELGA